MNKLTIALIVSTLTVPFVSNANASARIFKNCTELNRVYPGGVALPGAVNVGGSTKNLPKFSRALYLANKKSDRDKDGIACEK